MLSLDRLSSSRFSRLLVLGAVLCLLVPSALAQVEVRIGGKEGGNFATFGGSDGQLASAPNQAGATLNRRPGFIIGGLVEFDHAGPLGVQTEMLWIWKGAKGRFADMEATTKLNYFEVPVLAKYETPLSWGPVSTHLLAGPTVAFATQSQRDLESVDAQGQSQLVGQQNLDPSTKNVELGVAVGGEIGYDFSDSAQFVLGMRYRRGLTRTFGQTVGSQASAPDAWNQGLAVTLGFIYSSGWTFSL